MNRNRYSYVLNNPVKYTDPSGHAEQTLDDPVHPEDPMCHNTQTQRGEAWNTSGCLDAMATLRHYGIVVMGDWYLQELTAMLQMIHDFMRRVIRFTPSPGFGEAAAFKEVMGIDENHLLALVSVQNICEWAYYRKVDKTKTLVHNMEEV